MRTLRPTLVLVLAVATLVASAAPFAGLAGVVPFVLARRHGGTWRARVSLCLAALATAIALGWAVVYAEPPRAIVRAESPVVSSVAGGTVTKEGSFVSGALYPWAERRDVLRVARASGDAPSERAFRVDGIAGETLHIDSASLLSVAHDEGVEIVPTTTQTLVSVREPLVPLRLVFDDAVVHGEPTRTWRLEAPRPASARAVLVLEARTTAFAEEAFARYLGTMGQGMDPFMASVTKETCSDACRQEVWDDETERLGIPLVVQPEGGARELVAPVGSQGVRRFGVVLDATKSRASLSVTLSATPGFWEIEHAWLAPYEGDASPEVITPTSARLRTAGGAEDVRALVMESDRTRVALHDRESLDLLFPPALPAAGRVQSTFIALRAHYRVPTGGRRFLNVAAIAAHRVGLTSLPRYSRTLVQ